MREISKRIRKSRTARYYRCYWKPTPWLIPLVAVNKDENNVRICIDMRCANQAIQRTRYPVPTLDDLLVELKGAKHFIKLDLRSAFHQLELDEESRYITAFRTENKVKQYKRLIFGVNSAPEELQQRLQTILADIDGVTNIADDILIYGITIEQHDKALASASRRFRTSCTKRTDIKTTKMYF